jgi:hypothetical protein
MLIGASPTGNTVSTTPSSRTPSTPRSPAIGCSDYPQFLSTQAKKSISDVVSEKNVLVSTCLPEKTNVKTSFYRIEFLDLKRLLINKLQVLIP